jgi:transcriptional regulator NrdR family protein
MNCPYCNSSTSVENSRSHGLKQSVWRRRKCKKCGSIWTTRENYDLSTTHRVKSTSTDQIQPFSRDLLLFSITDSLKHLKQSQDVAGDLTDTIISKLLILNEAVITTVKIKEISIITLKSYDKTASAVYKALHRN